MKMKGNNSPHQRNQGQELPELIDHQANKIHANTLLIANQNHLESFICRRIEPTPSEARYVKHIECNKCAHCTNVKNTTSNRTYRKPDHIVTDYSTCIAKAIRTPRRNKILFTIKRNKIQLPANFQIQVERR